MKEATLLKIVDGKSIPLPRSLNGITGCSESTMNPQMNSTVLKISNAPVYCFQFIGPVSTRFSNQRKMDQGRYFPSMIQAMYLLIGIAMISVTTIIKKGKDHIAL